MNEIIIEVLLVLVVIAGLKAFLPDVLDVLQGIVMGIGALWYLAFIVIFLFALALSPLFILGFGLAWIIKVVFGG